MSSGNVTLHIGGNMALTKEKLITHLQTQIGLDRRGISPGSRTAFGDHEGLLGRGGRFTHQRFWKVPGEAKAGTPGEKSSNQKKGNPWLPINVLVFKSSGVLRQRINNS